MDEGAAVKRLLFWQSEPPRLSRNVVKTKESCPLQMVTKYVAQLRMFICPLIFEQTKSEYIKVIKTDLFYLSPINP